MTSTQPGTSPRSSGAVSRTEHQTPIGEEWVHGRSFPRRIRGRSGQSDQAGPEREDDGDGQHDEDNGHHHRDLPARRLDELTTAGFADVAGLRVEYSVSGVPRSIATATPCAKRATIGTPVVAASRSNASATGSPVRMAASTPARSRTTHRAAHDPVECGHRALSRGDGEGQQLGDGRELLDIPLARLDLSRQVLVAGEDADDETHEHSTRAAAGWPGCRGREDAVAGGHREAGRPHSTCSTRKSCTVASRPARASRRRTDYEPPRTRSTASAAARSTGPKTPRAAEIVDGSGRGAAVAPRRGTSRT